MFYEWLIQLCESSLKWMKTCVQSYQITYKSNSNGDVDYHSIHISYDDSKTQWMDEHNRLQNINDRLLTVAKPLI